VLASKSNSSMEAARHTLRDAIVKQLLNSRVFFIFFVRLQFVAWCVLAARDPRKKVNYVKAGRSHNILNLKNESIWRFAGRKSLASANIIIFYVKANKCKTQ
jgi:hypothetical protein